MILVDFWGNFPRFSPIFSLPGSESGLPKWNGSGSETLFKGVNGYAKTEEEEEEKESIEYQHICKLCDHVIGKHKVIFFFFVMIK